MADPGCVFLRTLLRSGSGSGSGATKASSSSSSPAVVCREQVLVVDLQRYGRDQGSSVYFPQAVLSGSDLYDVTLTDGDCRLRVTLDPGLNRLVERHVLRAGAALRDAAFAPSMACPGASPHTASYRLVSVTVKGQYVEEEGVRSRWASLPWFRPAAAAPGGPLLPLRANRVVFLPLWNNVDFSGAAWRETPPPEEEDEEEEEEDEEEEAVRPAATIEDLRQAFLSGQRGVARGVVRYRLIARIVNKSHLMYYGKTERNCECPYKAVLEVCDVSGSVCVVLWNSVCVSWYRRLKPGDVVALSHYRVKQRYQADNDDIEISVNSRNPASRMCVLPEWRVRADSLPPAPAYGFRSSKELRDGPDGSLCDVIGLLTFTGRAERVRVKEGRGAELAEYRWLQLEDGDSHQPIMVKLFSTSQPHVQRRLLPLSVVVCCRLKVMKAAAFGSSGCFYLTNTSYTQVYCTGTGHHSEMSYRKLAPVRGFLRWLREQDDQQALSRATVGGFFLFPPPPLSLETFMKDRRGEPGFLRGAELHRGLERLCYRERRSFCVQAVVTMVTHSRRGEEQRCLFWMDRASSLSPSSSSSPRSSLSSPPTPRSSRPPPSSPSSLSSSSFSPSSAVSHATPGTPLTRNRKLWKRKALLQPDTPNKRRPQVTLQPQVTNKKVILFESSMEFLENSSPDEDEEQEDDASSYVTCLLPPAFAPVAPETLTMRYDHERREEQAAAVAMGGSVHASWTFQTDEYYTLRLKALSDGVSMDAIFLPGSSSSPLCHSNTWTSILSHGAFSTHAPPPSPADLIAMATQLANQRLVCVLEACHLGGDASEMVLSRAFQLMD